MESPAERGLGVQAGSRFSMRHLCVLAAKTANHVLGCIKHSTVRRGDYPAAFSISAASPGALCAVLGPVI